MAESYGLLRPRNTSGVLPVDDYQQMANYVGQLENWRRSKGAKKRQSDDIPKLLAMIGDAYNQYQPPETALGMMALPAKAVYGLGQGAVTAIEDFVKDPSDPKKSFDAASIVVGGGGLLSRATDLPKGAVLGANILRSSNRSQPVELLPSQIAKIPHIARDMGVSEDIAAGLMREGKISAEVNPISPATKKEVGFHTPYSGSRKVKTDKLNELIGGYDKQTPNYGKLGTSAIEDFKGQTLFPMALDRTSRDLIKKVNNIDVGEYNVPGGYRYWLDSLKGGGGGMASGHSVMSNYRNISDNLKGKGVGVGDIMSGRGSDYATAGTDIAKRMGMFDNMSKDTRSMLSSEVNAKITAGNAATIKSAKEKAKKDGVPYEEPKITNQVSEDLNSEFMSRLDSEPALRKAFMEAVDLDRVAKNPEIIDAITLRHAITDDRFRHLTRGEGDPLSGMDFIKLKGDLMPSKNAPSPNPSYSHHMQGDYKPPLLVPTPRSVLFPEFTAKMVEQGRPTSEWNYMFDRMKPRQKVDQRVIDEVNQYKDGILKGF